MSVKAEREYMHASSVSSQDVRVGSAHTGNLDLRPIVRREDGVRGNDFTFPRRPTMRREFEVGIVALSVCILEEDLLWPGHDLDGTARFVPYPHRDPPRETKRGQVFVQIRGNPVA